MQITTTLKSCRHGQNRTKEDDYIYMKILKMSLKYWTFNFFYSDFQISQKIYMDVLVQKPVLAKPIKTSDREYILFPASGENCLIWTKHGPGNFETSID